jgi:hypothetical protein
MSQDNEPPPDAVIEGHAEAISSEPPPVAQQANALTLTPRPPAEREVLMPLDPERVVEGMRQYQQLLRDLLEPSDWQTEDKKGIVALGPGHHQRSGAMRSAIRSGILVKTLMCPSSGQVNSLAPGISSAVCRAWATGTTVSASP